MKKSQLRTFIKKIVTEAKLLENIKDPTKEEMVSFLNKLYGKEEDFRDSAEIAIYWFSNFYHGGQSSNLYSTLSTSRFNPGPVAKGPEPHSLEEMMYEALVLEYAKGSEEAHEIEHKYASLNEALVISPKNQAIIEKWIHEFKNNRKVAVRMIDSILSRQIGLSSSDLPDTVTFANGLDEIEQFLNRGNFNAALETAYNTAKDMIAEEGGEGLMEGEEAEYQSSQWDGSDDDLESYGLNDKFLDGPRRVKKPSKISSPSKKQKPRTVQDFDWETLQKIINRDTLKETEQHSIKDLERFAKQEKNPFVRKAMGLSSTADEDADYVEYIGPWGNEKPFTLKTPNGTEKFEFCKGKYPSGKEDLAVYAFRGDVCYGYQAWRKMHGLDGHMG